MAHRSSWVGPSIFSQQPFPNAVLQVPAGSWTCPAPASLHASAQVFSWSKRPFSSPSSHPPHPYLLPPADHTGSLIKTQPDAHLKDTDPDPGICSLLLQLPGTTNTSGQTEVLPEEYSFPSLPFLSPPLVRRMPCPVPLPWPQHLLWQGNVSRCEASGDLKSAAWFGCALVHLSCICHGGVSHVVSGPRRTNTWSRSEPNPPAWLKRSQPGAWSRTAPGDPWVHEIEKIKTTALCLWEFWWVTDVSHCTIVPRVN